MLRSFKDQIENTVTVSFPPRRIVSLVPSQTELLHHLGLEEETIAITKFCVHPKEWFKTKTRVGGTKTIKKDVLKSLHPDLIIANKEENVKAQIEELQEIAPVWVSDIKTLKDAMAMIQSVGELTDKQKEAKKTVAAIKHAFEQLTLSNQNYRTAYLVWKDPYITVGGDTFINDMLTVCGLTNIYATANRYPQTSLEKLSQLQCELLLLSSEPFPFSRTHLEEIQQQLPTTKIVLVDGEMFSWYGSRLLQSPSYFNKLLNSLP